MSLTEALASIGSALAAAAFYGINWPHDDLAEGFKQPVLLYLQAEQSRRITATFAPNGASKLTHEELQKLSEASEAAHRITITSLKVRGTFRKAVAQVSYLVDGKTPSDGHGVRYLLLRQAGFGDWHVDRGTTVLSYYFAF